MLSISTGESELIFINNTSFLPKSNLQKTTLRNAEEHEAGLDPLGIPFLDLQLDSQAEPNRTRVPQTRNVGSPLLNSAALGWALKPFGFLQKPIFFGVFCHVSNDGKPVFSNLGWLTWQRWRTRRFCWDVSGWFEGFEDISPKNLQKKCAHWGQVRHATPSHMQWFQSYCSTKCQDGQDVFWRLSRVNTYFHILTSRPTPGFPRQLGVIQAPIAAHVPAPEAAFCHLEVGKCGFMTRSIPIASMGLGYFPTFYLKINHYTSL